jgi:hypothetical protein
MLEDHQRHCQKTAMPPEVQKLGRTFEHWFDKIANFHLARESNGPTRALNNLIKRIKRIGFGFRKLQELPHPGDALHRTTELASARLDRGQIDIGSRQNPMNFYRRGYIDNISGDKRTVREPLAVARPPSPPRTGGHLTGPPRCPGG